MSNEELQKMIENGELGCMTECAYGSAIAKDEINNTLKKDNKEKDKKDM